MSKSFPNTPKSNKKGEDNATEKDIVIKSLQDGQADLVQGQADLAQSVQSLSDVLNANMKSMMVLIQESRTYSYYEGAFSPEYSNCSK